MKSDIQWLTRISHRFPDEPDWVMNSGGIFAVGDPLGLSFCVARNQNLLVVGRCFIPRRMLVSSLIRPSDQILTSGTSKTPLYQMSRLPLSYLTSQCTLPYIGCCQGKVGCGCVGVGKQEVSGGGPEEGCSLLNVETRGCRICRRSSDHLPAETRSRNKLFSCASLNLMLNLKNPQ